MRNMVMTVAAVLAALFLLYGGLNLAERGMNEMMALDRSRAAFTVQKCVNGYISVTFGGRTFTINLERLVERLHPDLQQ